MLMDQGSSEFLRGAGTSHGIDLQHNPLLCLPDDEIGQFLASLLPVDGHILDNSFGRTAIAQRNELLQTFMLTCGNGLDTAIGEVADPTGQSQLTSTVANKDTESYILD